MRKTFILYFVLYKRDANKDTQTFVMTQTLSIWEGDTGLTAVFSIQGTTIGVMARLR